MINRHTKSCNDDRARYYRSSTSPEPPRCECGVADADPHWYKKRLDICYKLRFAFVHCQHYKEFNNRLLKFFEAELKEYFVSLKQVSTYSNAGIGVYGKGIQHNNPVNVY